MSALAKKKKLECEIVSLLTRTEKRKPLKILENKFIE